MACLIKNRSLRIFVPFVYLGPLRKLVRMSSALTVMTSIISIMAFCHANEMSFIASNDPSNIVRA